MQSHLLRGSLPQYPKPLVKGELMGEADNQAAGKQINQRNGIYKRRIVCNSAGAIKAKDSLKKVVMKKIWKIKMRPQVNSSLKITLHHNFQCRYSDSLELPTTNRQKHSTHWLRIRPPGRLRRGRPHKCWITISTIWSSSNKK